MKFSDLEKSLAEYDRARYLFELAIEQPVLDMPELLWKTYIDFEAELEEYEKVKRAEAGGEGKKSKKRRSRTRITSEEKEA